MTVIDIETQPYNPSLKVQPNAYALEPYRDEFYVSMVGIHGNNHSVVYEHGSDTFVEDVTSVLKELDGQVVFCHNALFDISGLIRLVGWGIVKRIKWKDSILLSKWVSNSQLTKSDSHTLAACVERHLPGNTDFLEMKDNQEDDKKYWLDRALSDCKVTFELVNKLFDILPKEQREGFNMECRTLKHLARGYMQGISIDTETVEDARVMYSAGISAGLRGLNTEMSIVRSPAKLGNLIFEEWGLPHYSETASGKKCTAAGDLKHIAESTRDPRIASLLEVKSKMTVMSKYINGFSKTVEYVGDNTMHPVPRLFNSYTGRMSYTSKMKKKFQVGIALHQLPRKHKDIKKAMVAPKGYKFFYCDFAAQELRLMAHFSGDKVMIDAFNNGRDLHATMTETITGAPYDAIVQGVLEGDPSIIDDRNNGKLTNLSSMYRIGAKSLKAKFFEQYDKVISIQEARYFIESYKRTFIGIPRYWDEAIGTAARKGYAETVSGRRYYINKMDWEGESSAINMPIQGSGMDIAEVVITEVCEAYPDNIFQLAVHDSLTWLIPEDADHEELARFVNSVDFDKAFGKTFSLRFPLDCAVGINLADMENIV